MNWRDFLDVWASLDCEHQWPFIFLALALVWFMFLCFKKTVDLVIERPQILYYLPVPFSKDAKRLTELDLSNKVLSDKVEALTKQVKSLAKMI